MQKLLIPTVVHDIFVRQGCGAWQQLVERLGEILEPEKYEVATGWFCHLRATTAEGSTPWLGPSGSALEAAQLLHATHEEEVEHERWAAFFAAVREMR